MVNKAAVGILGVVVVVSLLVGVLIGMQLAGGGGTAEAPNGENGNDDGGAEATPVPDGNGTANAGNATNATATATATRTPISADEFNEAEINDWIVQFVNEERTSSGREPLIDDDQTARNVRRMARNHSEQMASHANLTHTLNGRSVSDRYQRNNLAQACQFTNDNVGWIYDPTQKRYQGVFEVIGLTYAGQPYEHNGSVQFNEDERAVAQSLVAGWMDDPDQRESLLRKGPTRLGAAVSITPNGRVYATANICA